MFFQTGRADIDAHSGEQFSHPPLVFKIVNRDLFVRALAQSTRPTANTKLYVAPYYNVSADSSVCIGSMPVPEATTLDGIDEWVRAFFQSAFSHPAGAVKLTRQKGGYPALVRALAGRTDPFPADTLVDAKQTLGEFLCAHEGA
jgi:PRTRC genetic system protein B